MKTKLLSLMIVVVLLISLLPIAVFAAAPVEYTIDVRNRTGAPVEFNYRGADGILHWVTVPEGVSSLTLMEGVYSYWVDPVCGHIAGEINLSQQRQILWITCDNAVPTVKLAVPVKTKPASTYVGGTCVDQGGDYGIWYTWSGGTYLEFWTEANWDPSGATWDQVWYWMVDPVGWAQNETNGNNDGPGYCGTYTGTPPAIYFDSYSFPPTP